MKHIQSYRVQEHMVSVINVRSFNSQNLKQQYLYLKNYLDVDMQYSHSQ